MKGPFDRLTQIIEGPNIKIEHKQKGLWVIAQRCGYLKVQAEFMMYMTEISWVKSTRFQSGWVADGEMLGSICTSGICVQEDVHMLELLFLTRGWPLEILAKTKYPPANLSGGDMRAN